MKTGKIPNGLADGCTVHGVNTTESSRQQTNNMNNNTSNSSPTPPTQAPSPSSDPTKIKVYVLGPMRGKEMFNFPAFDEMTARLNNNGFIAINPADMDREVGFDPQNLPPGWDYNVVPDGFNMADTVRRDVLAILECSAYVCLDGWERSTGASAEQKLLAWQGSTRLDPDRNFLPWTEDSGCNPKDKLGLKKTPLRLIPWTAIPYLAKVMAVGAKKYSPFNWRRDKPRASIYYEAALRHLLAGLDGQDNDDETGLPHAAHVMANMAILLDAQACGTLKDDRDKSGKVSEILKKLSE